MIKTEIRTIGPDEAHELLSRNTHNRNLDLNWVAKLADDMRAGNWTFHGAPIEVANDGTLLNGQHRLAAITKTGLTFAFVVVTGLPRESQDVMDIGRKRTLAQVLQIRGVPQATALAAALAYVWAWEKDADFSVAQAGWRPSNKQALETLERHPGLAESCKPGRQLAAHIKLPPSVAVFRHYQLGLIDPEDRDDFWDRLIHRKFESETDPLQLVYFKLLSDAASAQKRLPVVHRHALLVKAWNYYREGVMVRQLKWSRGGRGREEFPVAK